MYSLIEGSKMLKLERGPHGTIGIIKIENSDHLISYELEILESRQLSELIPVFLRTIRKNLELCYDITDFIALSDLDQLDWAQNVKRAALLNALHAVFSSENHYLSPEKFSFEKDHIYINPNNQSLMWCYIPVKIVNEQTNTYMDRIEKLLMSEPFQPLLTESERLHIIHLIQKSETSKLIDFLLNLQEKNTETDVQKTKIHPIIFLSITYLLYLCSCLVEFQFVKTKSLTTLNECTLAIIMIIYGIFIWKGNRNMNIFKKSEKIEKSISKDILFPPKETDSTNEAHWPPYFLLEINPNNQSEFDRKAIILTDEFILGKDPLVCDYVLSDEKLEDAHAKIEKKEDKFYISDMYSEHGTWIKNIRLQAPQKALLESGDIIQLADTVLLFTDGQISQSEENL